MFFSLLERFLTSGKFRFLVNCKHNASNTDDFHRTQRVLKVKFKTAHFVSPKSDI